MLLIGLGNPGPEYEKTLHNVGFEVTKKMAAFLEITFRKRCFRLYRQAQKKEKNNYIKIIQPLTYMNNSGLIFKETSLFVLSRTEKEVVIVCDNMDLDPGMIRIKRRGKPSTHKGLRSIESEIGDLDYIIVYVGIGRPLAGVTVVDHVLSKTTNENKELIKMGEQKAFQAVLDLYQGKTLEEVQFEFNGKKKN
ncbi:MAG: aminoacyl-tRNA hydrolase [Sphaerochaetaceae bacterium]